MTDKARNFPQMDNAGNLYVTIAEDGSLSIGPRTQTPTGNVLQVQIGPGDVISNIPVVLDYAHHQLHEGETWQYTYGPAAIAQNAIVYLRLVVADVLPTLRTPHAVMELDTTNQVWLQFYETPTTSAPGTAAAFYNRNRNTAGSPTTTIFTAPTVTKPGTMISAWIVGSGQKAGGGTKESIEWDLKANTVYLYKFTAQDAGNICFRLIQYEDHGV